MEAQTKVPTKGFMELMHELIERMNTNGDESAQNLTARAKIFAARMRLQNTVDQADALDAIREIAANLMGCEELALYKTDHAKAALWLYWSFGIDPNQHAVLDVVSEAKLADALTGSIVFPKQGSSSNLLNIEPTVNAIVPIVVADGVVAVLVIFRLLPQKTALDAADREVCRVLSSCAGRAIGQRIPNFPGERT